MDHGIDEVNTPPRRSFGKASEPGSHSPFFVVIRHRCMGWFVRVLLPNRPRALLLRGGWASKRFLVVVRSSSVLLAPGDDDHSRLRAISRDLPSFLLRPDSTLPVVLPV